MYLYFFRFLPLPQSICAANIKQRTEINFLNLRVLCVLRFCPCPIYPHHLEEDHLQHTKTLSFIPTQRLLSNPVPTFLTIILFFSHIFCYFASSFSKHYAYASVSLILGLEDLQTLTLFLMPSSSYCRISYPSFSINFLELLVSIPHLLQPTAIPLLTTPLVIPFLRTSKLQNPRQMRVSVLTWMGR